MRRFYGVQFLSKSVTSFVICYQLSQLAEEKFFFTILNNMNEICNDVTHTIL